MGGIPKIRSRAMPFGQLFAASNCTHGNPDIVYEDEAIQTSDVAVLSRISITVRGAHESATARHRGSLLVKTGRKATHSGGE
jgi:hypothetical protein